MRICEPPPQLRSNEETRLTDEEEPGYWSPTLLLVKSSRIPHSCVTLQISRNVCGWASPRKRGQLISPQYNRSSAKNDDTMDPIRVCNVGFYCEWGLSRSSVVTRWVVGGTDWDTYLIHCAAAAASALITRTIGLPSTHPRILFLIPSRRSTDIQKRLLSCPMCCLV